MRIAVCADHVKELLIYIGNPYKGAVTMKDCRKASKRSMATARKASV